MAEARGEPSEWIAERVERLTGERISGRPVVFRDTTNYMYIDRGHVVGLGGDFFLIRGNEKEGRFGIDEQPKFWVKRAISLSDGRKRILKLVCEEAFKIQVGTLHVTCWRSGEKEARVLDLVRGDSRFMQGYAHRDSQGNIVRVLDFIEGIDLLSHIDSLNLPHAEYFCEHFPSILSGVLPAFEGIQFLNENGLCHGDIRNDHIMIEREGGEFRWIDFDLTQDSPLFDLWSLGNILHCIVCKGFVTFRDVLRFRPDLSGRLAENDASAFFTHRVMNLGKVFPYLPAKLNQILERFSLGARRHYDSVAQVVEDLGECSSIL
jgi:serine/threonine protein kinase